MGAMESQRGTTGLVPTPPAIKDSPAVERALSRSKLYLLISWSMLYPEDDEFLDYLQSGEFVQDGRSAIESLHAIPRWNRRGSRKEEACRRVEIFRPDRERGFLLSVSIGS